MHFLTRHASGWKLTFSVELGPWRCHLSSLLLSCMEPPLQMSGSKQQTDMHDECWVHDKTSVITSSCKSINISHDKLQKWHVIFPQVLPEDQSKYSHKYAAHTYCSRKLSLNFACNHCSVSLLFRSFFFSPHCSFSILHILPIVLPPGWTFVAQTELNILAYMPTVHMPKKGKLRAGMLEFWQEENDEV